MKRFFNIFIFIILPPLITLVTIIFLYKLIPNNLLKSIIFFVSCFLSFLIFYFKVINKPTLFKSFFTLNVSLSILFSTYLLLKHFEILDYFSNVNIIKNFILSTGFLGVFIYVLLHFLQVVFLPIPAVILILAGTLIYGPFESAIYTTIGIMLGSYVSFYIGRIFGLKIVNWIVGSENVLKYQQKLSKNGDFLLAMAFLFPFFPDDVLCMIAGLTDMSFKRFFMISTLTRPIGVFTLCYFGGGTIIPYNFGGFSLMLLLLILVVVLFFILMKNQNKITKMFNRDKNK